jgi:hypothetical protein
VRRTVSSWHVAGVLILSGPLTAQELEAAEQLLAAVLGFEQPLQDEAGRKLCATARADMDGGRNDDPTQAAVTRPRAVDDPP